MDNPLLSVIIPVYNVEKYLDECVMSVINQTYKNIEVILVDDGSPDRSGWMCDEWAKKDARVRVIHNENRGPGATRNSGIEVSRGEFVAFVDSDDYIDVKMYETMIDVAIHNDVDIVYSGGFNKFMGNGEYNKVCDVSSVQSFCSEQIGELSYCFVSPDNKYFERRLIMSPCRALYRRCILSRFFEERDVPSEDLAFNVECVLNSRKITFIPNVFYWYRYNESSLTRTFNFEKYHKYKRLTEILNNIFVKYNLNFTAEYCMMITVIDMLRGMYFSNASFLQRKNFICQMAEDSIWDEIKLDLSKMKVGNKIVYCLLKSHSPIMLQIFSELYYFIRKRMAHD